MARRVGRRFFLHTAAGATLGLPFLPSLMPRNVHAGGVEAPRRFVAIQSCSGQFVTDWFPAWRPDGYQLRDDVYGDEKADGTTALHETMPETPHTWARLADFSEQGISRVLTSELDPYLDKMLLLRGLDLMQGTSHGNGMFLGNLANCTEWEAFYNRGLREMPTIDQVLAYSDRFYPSAPRMRSLPLSTGSTSSFSFSDYGSGGAVEMLSSYIEPQHLWQDLFGDFMPQDVPRENPNRLLMNAIHEDYTRVRGHRRLGAADREALERHVAFLADIERELGATLGAGCVRPDEPPLLNVGYPWYEVSSIEDFQLTVSLLVDIAVAAIRCDLTRIVTMSCGLALTDATGELAVSYHNSDNVDGDWHDFAHDAAFETMDHDHIVSLNRWVVEAVFARFLEQLDVVEADGRTFLDNSLVILGGELSMDHYVQSQPTLLAGSAGGMLQTGYYVDYTQLDHTYANKGTMPWGILIPGIPYNRLYVTILQAMGLSPADYERDGLAGYGHREVIGGPWQWPADPYDMGRIGSPLPGIFLG